MKIIYGKTLTDEQFNIVVKISEECGIMFDTARLLFNRNIDSVKKAKEFLSPGKHRFLNPFNLLGMKEAVERISRAKENGENVLVFGDYDADGICATSVLYCCLKDFGIDARMCVPEREEGYGLNVEKILTLNNEQKIDLLITVDCGISDFEKIEQLKGYNIDVIVTDHHEPPENLPRSICINPKISGQKYGFSELCGAGVAYKVGYALIGEEADKYLDFVSIATVADSMELIGENRDITFCGLKLFNNEKTLRTAFKYLLGDNHKQVNAQTIAYTIAPRINAGGRMGDANTALKLFTEKDEALLFDYATKLCEYNIARQAECDRIYKEAKTKITLNNLDDNSVILVADDGWKTGFVGIVAARLVEDYCRPVIVFAGYDGYYKGSARSVEGVNIYEAINNSKDLLIAYGGHSQASGVSVEKEKFNEFSKAVNIFVEQNRVDSDTTQKVFAEWNIERPVNIRFAKEIEMLEPFGVGNKRPLFTTDVNQVDSIPLKPGSLHYSYKTPVLEMLDFCGEKNVMPLSLPVKKKIVFELNYSVFKSRESVKGYVRSVNICSENFESIKYNIFSEQLKCLLCDEKEGVKEATEEDFILNSKTVYVINDPQNLTNYPNLKNLPVSIFTRTGKGQEIIISPNCSFECEKIIYLDIPMQYINHQGEVKRYGNLIGYKAIDNVSTDRGEFARVFSKLVALSGKIFKDSANFAKKYFDGENLYQIIFVIEVFCELKIFKITNGKFVYDQKVKNALTNSKVYSKIYKIKA